MSGTVGPCYIGTCGTDVVVSDAAVVDEVTGRLCVLYDGVLCPGWVCGDICISSIRTWHNGLCGQPIE
jgi:hypothetical protein